MRRLSLRHAVVGVAAIVAALAVGASVASAGQSAMLSLQVIPSTLVSGGPGWVSWTFTNTGTTPLNDVILTFGIGTSALGGTFVSSGPSTGPVVPDCTGNGSDVSCSLGTVPAGGVVQSMIAYTAPTNCSSSGPCTFSVSGSATWDALTNGHPSNSSTHTSVFAQTVNVVDSYTFPSTNLSVPLDSSNVSFGCGEEPVSFGNSTDPNINVEPNGNTSGLPCSPIIAGTTTAPNGCGLLFEKLASGQTATVTLTFPDECLPWPNNNDGTYSGPRKAENAGQPLLENPNFPNPGPEWSVPWCDENGLIPSFSTPDPSTGLDYSTDACISSITATDTAPPDADEGMIQLYVVGSDGDSSFNLG